MELEFFLGGVVVPVFPTSFLCVFVFVSTLLHFAYGTL